MLIECFDVITDYALQIIFEVLHDDKNCHVILILTFGVVGIFAWNNKV